MADLENMQLNKGGKPTKGDWFNQNLGGRKLEQKEKEPGWLDKILGGLGSFAQSDMGGQILGGLISQAVSDQSYGGQTFLAGMGGAKEAQQAKAQKEAAAQQQAFENKMDVEELGVKKQKNINDMLGTKVDAKEAGTKAERASAEIDKWSQQQKMEAAQKAKELLGDKSYDSMSNKDKIRAMVEVMKTGGIVSELTGESWLPGRTRFVD